jgi:hypothetical protein
VRVEAPGREVQAFEFSVFWAEARQARLSAVTSLTKKYAQALAVVVELATTAVTAFWVVYWARRAAR